jgi:hypothetical protein
MAKVESKCSIYVVFSGKKVKIPVNPEEIQIQYPTDHQTYEIVGMGQIVVPKKPALKTVSWEGLFPGDRNASYVNSGAGNPQSYVRRFEKALKEKQTCRLIISRSSLYDTNMKCIVSNFETTDKGGEPDDIYYSVELQEFKSYSPKVVTVITNTAASTASAQAETARPMETPVMRVGASVVANGRYYYDSYGGRPYGTANSLSTTVTRIVSGNPYPIHIGHYGWVQESQLQITG